MLSLNLALHAFASSCVLTASGMSFSLLMIYARVVDSVLFRRRRECVSRLVGKGERWVRVRSR